MSQSDFRAALLNPDLPVPPGLTDPAGRPAGRRFDVYRNNVTVGLIEALAQSFPAVRKLVGAEFFAALARAHLRAHPPATPLMMFFGEAMPAFLERFPPVRHLGYLPDVARLELALRQSYHAADATPVAPDRLQAIAPEALMTARLAFAPAVRLLRSAWPVHAIWMANMRGTAPPAAVTPQDVLIVRPAFDAEPLLLPEGGAAFLAALMAGVRLGAACESAGAFDLTATLGLLLAGGAITELHLGESQ
jgi:hypothetical protein